MARCAFPSPDMASEELPHGMWKKRPWRRHEQARYEAEVLGRPEKWEAIQRQQQSQLLRVADNLTDQEKMDLLAQLDKETTDACDNESGRVESAVEPYP